MALGQNEKFDLAARVFAVLLLGALVGVLVARCEAQAATKRARLPDLAAAIHRVPSTGRPSADVASRWAGLFAAHCRDPWLGAGVALHTSGLRPTARGVKGEGLMGLNPSYTPVEVAHDPERAIPLGCAKLAYWQDWCRGDDHAGHDFVSHYASGYKVTARAVGNAARVREMVRRLRAAAAAIPAGPG